MFCVKCGAQNKDNFLFCTNCGSKFETQNKFQSQEQFQQPLQPHQQPVNQMNHFNQIAVTKIPKKTNNKLIGIISCVILVIAIIVISVIAICGSKGINNSGSSYGKGNAVTEKNKSSKNELKISDLNFIFDDGIFDYNQKNASFQFRNNSDYEIFYIELMMRLKDDIEIPEEYKESYEETISIVGSVFVRIYFNEYWDIYLEDTDDFWAEYILTPVKPGETSGKIMVHRNNIYYVKDSSELDNFEFDEITIRYYIDGGAYEKTVIYNYKKDKHTYGEEKPIKESVQKPTKKTERELSDDETPIDLFKDIEIFTEVTDNNELEFWFTNNSKYTITEFSKYYHIDKQYFPKEVQDDILISETFSFKYNNEVRPGETSKRRLMSDFLSNGEILEKLDKNNFKYASDSDFSVRYKDGNKKYYLSYINGKYTLTEQ